MGLEISLNFRVLLGRASMDAVVDVAFGAGRDETTVVDVTFNVDRMANRSEARKVSQLLSLSKAMAVEE
ncbi:hypothetical protein ACLOJK_034606 [Asimina triloba]